MFSSFETAKISYQRASDEGFTSDGRELFVLFLIQGAWRYQKGGKATEQFRLFIFTMKHYYLKLLFVLLFATAGTSAHAYEEVQIDGIKYLLNSQNSTNVAAVTTANYSGSIIIPSSVKYKGVTYDVISIWNQAFYGCDKLTSIVIPSSVIEICKYAFRGCNGLTSITIPNSVTSIGEGAFMQCERLTSITLPNSITRIENMVFAECKSLTNITIPNNVNSIGEDAFFNCSGLTSVTIPNSVTKIGDYAFERCSGLTNIVISNGLTSIGYRTFYECSKLSNIIIPNNVKSIGESAFENCKNLRNIYISSSVKTIGDYTFNGCINLESINVESGNSVFDSRDNCNAIIRSESNELILGSKNTFIPNSVTSIYERAFRGCSGLTNITIPNSVKSIGNYVFNDCVNLESIIVENGNSVYDSRDNCNAIIKTETNELVAGCKNTIIPHSVTSIGSFAFSGCSGLTCIIIPNSVTNINRGAFSYCGSLESIVVENDNPVFDSRDNCNAVIKTNTNELVAGCKGTIIPNSILTIGQEAFYGCSGLSSITIPESVKELDAYAFWFCDLKTLKITSEKIGGMNVFYYFQGLDTRCVILCKGTCVDYIKGRFSGEVFSYDEAYSIDATPYLKGFSLKINKNDYCEQEGGEVRVMLDDKEISLDDKGEYYKDGLDANTSYSVQIAWRQGSEDMIVTKRIRTKTLNNVSFSVNADYTTADVKINASEDMTYNIIERGIYIYPYGGNIAEKIVRTTDSNSNIEITGLIPAKKYSFDAYVKYDDGTIEWYSKELRKRYGEYAYFDYLSSYKTKGTDPFFIESSISYNSTGFKCMVWYNAGPLHVTSARFEGQQNDGTTLSLTGLQPGKTYSIKYTVKTEEGSEETITYNFATAPLSFVTNQPKVISEGNVIVSTETNLDEEETNVGFEWRRIDWTDDFASNKGVGFMYEGTMEGYIRNLNAAFLWKCRPYYVSDSGDYYYGDWVGIDPSNTSYFEPTVHTYSTISVEGNTAQVKGYAIRGSDNVVSQGFKYWKVETQSSKYESGTQSVAVPVNAKTVEASGQVMTAELTGLEYNSSYTYVAYITTSEGETFYGKELSFKTGENPSGIMDVEIITETKPVSNISTKGIFTLTGFKVADDESELKSLPQGIYIVNGKKLLVK